MEKIDYSRDILETQNAALKQAVRELQVMIEMLIGEIVKYKELMGVRRN